MSDASGDHAVKSSNTVSKRRAKTKRPMKMPATAAQGASKAVSAVAPCVEQSELLWGGFDEHVLDRQADAALARLTFGLSPASLIEAYSDWAMHLAASPGKQATLVQKAVRKALRLWLHAAHCTTETGPCIEPLPQDKRFVGKEWQTWPFKLMYQSFLLNQQWWHNATTGIRGVSKHHEEVVSFAARQILDVFSPSNFILTNPEARGDRAASGRQPEERIGQPS